MKYLTISVISKKTGLAFNTIKNRLHKGRIPKKFLKVVSQEKILVSEKYLDYLKK